MTFTEASQNLKIPAKLIRVLHDMGVVSSPLTPAEVSHLRFLAKFWRMRSIIRLQLAHFNKKERISVATGAEMSKVERYILNRYLNLKDGKRITARQVALEVYTHYGISIDRKLMDCILKMREKAYNARRSQKKKLNVPKRKEQIINSK